MGKLYIVSTPIGNLDDITLRAIKILGQTHFILAEDTRSAHILLQHYNISGKELISFYEGNEEGRSRQVIDILDKNEDVALISESGTPLISDPGFKLIKEVLAQKKSIEAIPGPTALITALTLSGFPPNAFVFLGFLPKKYGKIKKIFEELKLLQGTVVKTVIFYESPYRVLASLNLIKAVFDNIEVVIAREITKIHEEIRRERVIQSIKHFEKVKPRGEFTILLKLASSDH